MNKFLREQYGDRIKRVWRKSEIGGYEEGSFLLRLGQLVIIVIRLFSLTNFKYLGGAAWRREFMDYYVLGWLMLLSAILFWLPERAGWHGWLAAYYVAELVHYRVYFLLVKGWDEPWPASKLRRSLVMAMINVAQLVIGYAILYRSFASIGPAGSSACTAKVLEPVQAIYFSMVTFATVGYGDYAPLNDLSRRLVISEICSSLLIMVLLIPVLVAGMRLHEERTKKD